MEKQMLRVVLVLGLVIGCASSLMAQWAAPRTWVTGEVVTAAQFNAQIRDNLLYLKAIADGGFKIGDVIYASSSASRTGWLAADGAAVSRTTYAALFAVIGVTYGAGDGVTTFHLPDLRGRYMVGVPGSGTLGAAVGTALTDAENRAVGQHTHTITDPGHRHNNAAIGGSGGSVGSGSSYQSVDPTAYATTGITIDSSGAVAGTNAPYVQMIAYIKY